MVINDIVKVPPKRKVKVTKATASLLQRQRRRIQAQRRRRWMERSLYLLWITCGAIATHKLLSVVTNTHSPILVALSGGIRNLPDLGDVLFINNCTVKVGIGDDVVFVIKDRNVPSFHRIMRVHEDAQTDRQVDFLTKGDDNGADDRGFYAPGQRWLPRKDIIGNVVGYLPRVGLLPYEMWNYPMFGWVLFGAVGRSIVKGTQPIFGRPSRSSIMFYLLVLSAMFTGCST